MRGLFTLILATIAALVGGVIGFQLGVTSNIGAAGGTVVWHAGFGFFGFFFPFLFFFLFIGLLFARLRRPAPRLGRTRLGPAATARTATARRRPTTRVASGSPTPIAGSTRRRPAPAGRPRPAAAHRAA